MCFADARAEKNSKFSFFDAAYVLMLPRRASKAESDAKSATATLDAEQDNVVTLFTEKVSKDKAVMRLWIERLGDEQKLIAGIGRRKATKRETRKGDKQ